jgi:PAS domain S-box-containing protein
MGEKADGLLGEVLESLAEGVAILDNEGHLIFANQALAQLMGCEVGDLLGVNWLSLHLREPEVVTGEPQEVAGYQESILRHRTGTAVPVLINRRALHAAQGAVLLTFTAVQESQDRQARLRQMEEMARTSQHVSSVVHEMKNSLAILLLQTKLLSTRTRLSSETGDGLAVVRDQIRRMAQMVDNLRTCADPLEPSLESVDLNALIRHTLELQRPQLQIDSIQVTTELDADLPPILADPWKLQQVFVNLITNARQAMLAHYGGRLRIGTRVTSANGECVPGIQVRFVDSGPGIAPELMHRIFEPFFSTKEPAEGMGLGLSICDEIVRRHRGTIWAENNPEGGAILILELPIASRGRAEESAPQARLLPGHCWGVLRHAESPSTQTCPG